MESIEKLREWAADEHTVCRGLELETFKGKLLVYEKYALDTVIDWVEREIAEKYMFLPVDADGVPVKIGDMLEGWEHPVGGYRITVVNEYDEHQAVAEYDGKLHTRHIKPDPIKELLEEFGDRVARSGHQWGLDAPAIIDEYAGRFGELVR